MFFGQVEAAELAELSRYLAGCGGSEENQKNPVVKNMSFQFFSNEHAHLGVVSIFGPNHVVTLRMI